MIPLIGAHLSIAGGVDKALERGVALGCTTVQIFSKNNMQWFTRALGDEEIQRFHQRRQQTSIAPVFSHSGYLINLGATNPRFYEQSIRALADELYRAQLLGLPFVVLHPGSHMGRGEEAGIQQIASALDQVLTHAAPRSQAPRSEIPPRVALEVTAGQGHCLGCRFEHIARIYESVANPERLALCLDTCHLFAAGYDIRTRKGYEQTISELDRIIGIKQVVAIHMNDSKCPLGSRVDRHAHIGKGHLGLDPFRFILTDPRFAKVPKVLETPKENEANGISKMDKRNLAILKRLTRAATAAGSSRRRQTNSP